MKDFKFMHFPILLLFYFSIFPFSSCAYANILLKVVAVNPSKEQVQKVPVKAYLPKEVTAGDIIEREDLEVAYDSQQGSFYVYGEYEIKPGQLLERSIEIRDIWIVPEKEIAYIRNEAEKLFALLKNTDFAERITFLRESIETKVNQISETQKDTPPNPEQHISNYRKNLDLLAAAKNDLSLARNMLLQVKALPASMVWRLIVALIICSSLLGLGFYFFWHRQLKRIADTETFVVPKEGQVFEKRQSS